ncbi:MAG: TIGR00341 family protein [Methanobacteriota archaeon]|nr:MAG: TIGR00341 family protein [Euryarchaeota archaeon]
MALRLIELILPVGNEQLVNEILEGMDIEENWVLKVSEKRTMYRILLSSEETESLTDHLDQRFHNLDGYRIIVHPITASLPRPKEEKEKTDDEDGAEEPKRKGRIGREELYNETMGTAKLTKVYLVTVALSVIVASVGLVRDNVAVIIGAMVIAPLLGPNMALSLATTLADVKLARLSIRTLTVGVLLTCVLSLTLGYLLNVNPSTSELAARTEVGLGDIGLALASGSAGALFLTIGVSTALVGVMLAVALLPPLVTFGLLIGSGNLDLAIDALLLFMTNLICVNLAGVLIFVAQGVWPRSWWESSKARKLTIVAICIWCVLLSVLTALIILWGGFRF